MDMARLLPLIIILLLLLNSLPCRSDDQLTQAKPLSPGDKLISEKLQQKLIHRVLVPRNPGTYPSVGRQPRQPCHKHSRFTSEARHHPQPRPGAVGHRRAACSLDNSSEHHRRRWSGCRGATRPPVGERNRPPMAELRSPDPHHPSNHEGTRGVCLRAEGLVRRPRR